MSRGSLNFFHQLSNDDADAVDDTYRSCDVYGGGDVHAVAVGLDPLD